VLDLTAELGDTLTTSWALALHRARERGRLRDGQRAAILAFGSGVTLGAALYRV
jgi:3-oxoacyl-[acyl-carrier-protein] synthase III